MGWYASSSSGARAATGKDPGGRIAALPGGGRHTSLERGNYSHGSLSPKRWIGRFDGHHHVSILEQSLLAVPPTRRPLALLPGQRAAALPSA